MSRASLLMLASLVPFSCALGGALPLEYFTRQSEFGDLAIAPDGSYLAASGIEDGEGHITFYTTHPFEPVHVVRSDQYGRIDRIYWTSPERLLYTFARQYHGRMQLFPTGEIYGTNPDGGAQHLLYGYRASPRARTGTRLGLTDRTYADAMVVKQRADANDRIIICEHPWTVNDFRAMRDLDKPTVVSRLDVYTGKKIVMERIPLASAVPLLDADDRARFATGYDQDGELALIWKPEDDWIPFKLPGFRRDSVQPLRFTADNASVLIIGTPDGQSPSGLYELDLVTQGVERLYVHQYADISKVVLDPAGETVIGVGVNAEKPELHWLQPDHPTAKLYQALERAFPGQAVSITSASANQHMAVAWIYSDVNPGDAYLIDAETFKAEFLSAGRAWIDPAKMRRKEPVQIEARDGLLLHGYITRPRDDAGPYPLVVLPHDGPYGVRDGWGYDWKAQLLAHHGYAVLQINFRGSAGYGASFEEAGYREWGGKMQDDITDATRWAIDEKIAVAGNICIVGSGYGGYAALMGVVREPDLYRCVASDSGVTDLELLFRSARAEDDRAGIAYLERTLDTDADMLHARSPVSNAERMRIPVLLLHARDDQRYDYAHATRMRDALEKAGRKVELVSFGQKGREAEDKANRQETWARLLGFLARNLSGGSAPASD